MAQFGELDVRLEPWDVEYGSEFPLDAPEDVGAAEVSLDVETPAGSWDSIEPAPATIPGRIIFVDGVRRLEARIILRRNAKLCRGAFGSYAVGAVLATHGDATIREVRADRVIVVGSGEFLPEPIRLMRFAPALAYRPLSVASQDVDAPLRGILDQMRLAEERLARELADEENTLVVADGPLTFGDPLRGGAVGYIKRLQKLYIPEDKLDLLSRLPPRVTDTTLRFAIEQAFRSLRLVPSLGGTSSRRIGVVGFSTPRSFRVGGCPDGEGARRRHCPHPPQVRARSQP